MPIEKMVPKMGSTAFLDPTILKKVPNQKIVVTGCARSGTRFMKLLLNSKGINRNIGHERLYPGGIVSWMIGHKNQRQGILDAFENYPTIWIHLVRNPIKVIQSINRLHVDPKGRIGYQPFLDEFPGHQQYHDDINILGALHWMKWNYHIQETFPIDLTIKVEDINSGKRVKEVADLISIPSDLLFNRIKKLGTTNHSHSKKWADRMDNLLNGNFSIKKLKKENLEVFTAFKKAATFYGYDF